MDNRRHCLSITQNIDGRNLWQIWWIVVNSQKFYLSNILTNGISFYFLYSGAIAEVLPIKIISGMNALKLYPPIFCHAIQ